MPDGGVLALTKKNALTNSSLPIGEEVARNCSGRSLSSPLTFLNFSRVDAQITRRLACAEPPSSNFNLPCWFAHAPMRPPATLEMVVTQPTTASAGSLITRWTNVAKNGQAWTMAPWQEIVPATTRRRMAAMMRRMGMVGSRRKIQKMTTALPSPNNPLHQTARGGRIQAGRRGPRPSTSRICWSRTWWNDVPIWLIHLYLYDH